MKRNGKVICMAACVGMILFGAIDTQGQSRKDNSDISAGAMKGYFVNSMEDVPEDIRSFLNAPKGESPLPTAKYLQVCQNFAAWAQTVLKPEYVPNDQFIISHLQLFPATPTRRQDMAFLSCRKADMDYLIVQTGGLGGRVCLIKDRADAINVAGNPKAAMLANLTNYFILGEGKIPDFEVEKRGALAVLSTIKPSGQRNRLTLAKGILSDNQLAVSVDKWYFADTVAAHEPMPDEWFQSKARSVLQKPFPKP